MRVDTVISHLRDSLPALRLVGGAAEVAQAFAGLTTMPAAFVLPARESATASPWANQIVEQEVTAEFAVALAVRNLSDSEGRAAVDALEPVRVQVRDALLGWAPDAESGPCEYVDGDLVSFDAGVLWWQDRYRTSYVIRSQ